MFKKQISINIRDLKEMMKRYYDSTPEYYRSLEQIEGGCNQSLVSLIISHNFKNIIDAGCGVGKQCILLEKELKKQNYKFNYIIGYDISPHAIAISEEIKKQNNSNCQFYQVDLEAPWSKELESNVDIVHSSHVLEHLVNPTAFLDNVYRVLRNGGALYIAFPGIFKCFSIPFTHNAIPIKIRLLKLYDIFIMIFNRDYIKFRFTTPTLAKITDDSDMVFLSFTPEIVRFLEKMGFDVKEVNIKGFIIAFKDNTASKKRKRLSLIYLTQLMIFFIDLCYRKTRDCLKIRNCSGKDIL